MRYLGQTSFNETVIRLAWIAALDIKEADRQMLEGKVIANLQTIYPGDPFADSLARAKSSFMQLVTVYAREREWPVADFIASIQDAYLRFDREGAPKKRKLLRGSLFSRRWPVADRDAVFLVEVSTYMNGVLSGKFPLRQSIMGH